MTERLTDAELDELHRHGGSKRGNELTDRAIAELRELRAEVAAADEVIEQAQRVSESWRADYLKECDKNAKLRAALERIIAGENMYWVCIPPCKGGHKPNCPAALATHGGAS